SGEGFVAADDRPLDTLYVLADLSRSGVGHTQHERRIRDCAGMVPPDQHGQQQAGREDEGTHAYTLDAVHAAQKVARARPGQERREKGREDDELGQSEKERQHGYRGRAYDVRDLPGGFRAESASETD